MGISIISRYPPNAKQIHHLKSSGHVDKGNNNLSVVQELYLLESIHVGHR